MTTIPKRVPQVSDTEAMSILDGNLGATVIAILGPRYCAPCREVLTFLDEFADHVSTRSAVVWIDQEATPRVTDRLEIRGVPVFALVDRGAVKKGFLGIGQPHPLFHLCHDVDKYLSSLAEPTSSPPTLALTMTSGVVRLVSLLSDGTYHYLDSGSSFHGVVYSVSTQSIAFATVVQDFERMINDPHVKELHLQEFFEAHPRFILDEEYGHAHPQVALQRTTCSKDNLIPDFMLEPIDTNRLCDILELKLPRAHLIRKQRNRLRWSAAVMEAVAQLRTYRDFFDDERSRRRIEKAYGLTAYRPRLFLVIGRQGEISPLDMRRLESELGDVTIRTYDALLKRITTRTNALQSKLKADAGTH